MVPYEPVVVVLGEAESHAAPILGRANTLEKPCGFEPVDDRRGPEE